MPYVDPKEVGVSCELVPPYTCAVHVRVSSCPPTGVPRSKETASLPRTTAGPQALAYCRVLGGCMFA